MKENVEKVVALMGELGVTLLDLKKYINGIEKYPLEVYYRSGKHTPDVSYAKRKKHDAVGVVINGVVYLFPDFVRCEDIDIIDMTCFGIHSIKKIEGATVLPTLEQAVVLHENLEAYNELSQEFGHGIWAVNEIALDGPILQNSEMREVYDFVLGTTRFKADKVHFLPVIEL